MITYWFQFICCQLVFVGSDFTVSSRRFLVLLVDSVLLFRDSYCLTYMVVNFDMCFWAYINQAFYSC